VVVVKLKHQQHVFVCILMQCTCIAILIEIPQCVFVYKYAIYPIQCINALELSYLNNMRGVSITILFYCHLLESIRTYYNIMASIKESAASFIILS
jgi:hypothetical protein